MLTRNRHRMLGRVMLQHALIVREHGLFLYRKRRRRQCRASLTLQIRTHLPRKPRPAIGPAADHHPIGTGFGQGMVDILKRFDIPIDNHRQLRRLLHLADKRPVSTAFIHLVARAAMHGDHLNPRFLGNLRQLWCVEARVVPAHAHLQRHRNLHGPRHRFQNPPGQQLILHQRRAGILFHSDFFHRAAKINVNNLRPIALIKLRRLGHNIRVTPRQLHGKRELLRPKLSHAFGRFHLQHLRLGSNHLRDHQPDAKLLHQTAKRQIRHPRHRRKDDGVVELYISNFYSHQALIRENDWNFQ